MNKTGLITALETVLADTYAIYIKTQNYHWNVTGSDFPQLHGFFEKQYKSYIKPIDTIAERIRALKSVAPGSFQEFAKLATIDEPIKSGRAEDMINDLYNDQQKLVRSLQYAIRLSKEMEDEATLTILADRMIAHEKQQWMLGALLRAQEERKRVAA